MNKEEAIKLRLEGKTYSEISKTLGCSLDWCKRNLKGVKHIDITNEDFIELVNKGKSPECVTPLEIYKKLQPVKKREIKDEKHEKKLAVRRVKQKLKADNDVIIRQSWIHPMRASSSLNSMLMYINMLDDTLDEYVRSHLTEQGFDNLDEYDSTLAFMVMNSQYGSRILKNYPSGVFESLANAVDKIENRNGDDTCSDVGTDVNDSLDNIPY
jgi:hypothetical protein